MLLFLAFPLSFIPKRLIPLAILLSMISIGQMLIPSADNILVSDSYFSKGGYTSFFGYSTIYNSSLPHLLHGQYADNISTAVFGVHNWTIFILPILAIVIVSIILVTNE